MKTFQQPLLLKMLLMTCLLTLAGSITHAQTIRYVKEGGTGTGTSWADASGNLQNMINVSGDHEVWVAAGTYKPLADHTGNASPTENRTKTFVMKAGVKIYGGFPNTGNPTFAQRNWTTNLTILSGDFNNDDVVSGSGATLSITGITENAYHVVLNINNGLTTINALLDGFTIKGGNADNDNIRTISSQSVFDTAGGGMGNYNSSPSLINVTFTGNMAVSAGGLYNDNQSSPSLVNVNFTWNNAGNGNGGGMLNDNSSSPSLINVIFLGNRCLAIGGGICNADNSSPSLVNVTFSGNRANFGGGMYNLRGSSPTIKNSIIWGNSSGIFNFNNSNPTVTNSIVQDGGYTTNGNLSTDPLFVDAANGNLQLRSYSCAINTGDNNANNQAKDLAGNDRIYNNGTIDMGAYEYQNVRQSVPLPNFTTNNGLAFDGNNKNNVLISSTNANNCSLQTLGGGSAITIEYWFKGTNIQSAVRLQDATGFIVAGYSNSGFKHILSNDGGTTGIAVDNTTTRATDGNWHHVAMTWQKGVTNGFRSYLDGVLVESKNAENTDLPTITGGMYLGGHNGTQEFTTGTLDEVRIWNIARTQAEIQAGMCGISGTPTGLQVYYKFDHGIANGSNTSTTVLANSADPTNNSFTGFLQNFNLNNTTSNWVAGVPPGVPILYVKVGGTGDGTSWANASGNLQAMINASCVQEVWVAAGTYKPTTCTNCGTADREISFSMKAGVKIYGGFPNTGNPTFAQRNWTTNQTILSGDLAGNDGNNFTNNTENSYHVVVNAGNGLTTTALLDGFTIKGGNANIISGIRPINGVNVLDYGGGGMYNFNASPSFNNITFVGNYANDGGGIYNNRSSPSFNNVTFAGNNGVAGGGMYNFNGLPNLNNVVFAGNNASNQGGGMYNNGSSTPDLSNVTFTGNNASNQGGGIYSIYSTAIIKNTLFWDNIQNSSTSAVGVDIWNDVLSSATLNNSLLQLANNTTNYPSTKFPTIGSSNNLFATDPIFVNSANLAGADGVFGTNDDGLMLTTCSPVLNVGDNAANANSTDLAGNPRIYTPSGGQGAVIDMGAYEFQGTKITIPTPAPTTTDNVLNFVSPNGTTGNTVEIANCSGSNLAVTNALTIEYWFKGTSNHSAVRFQNGSNNFIVAGWSGKHIISTDGGTTGGVSVGAAATDGNWHHVAMTWQQGASFTSYLDGVQVQQINAGNTALPNINSGYYLGSWNGTDEFMNGSLDNVRVWNVVKSPAEIQAGMCSEPSSITGLLMHYKFNHGTAGGDNSTIQAIENSASTSYVGVLKNFTKTGTSSNFITSDIAPTSVCTSNTGIRYVKIGGAGTKDGTNWANASDNLHAMINATGDHQVWVAKGTYKPHASNRSVSFGMKAGVKIYGGFNDTGNPAFSDRNWATYETILSGDLGDNDQITGSGSNLSITNNGENSSRVVYGASNALLDGFTIKGGNCSCDGGGMYNNYSSPSLINVTFSGNKSGEKGGGMHNWHSSPSLTNVTFSRNIAEDGGGGMYNGYSSPSLINVTISGNNAVNNGGGMDNDYSSPTIKNSILWGNNSGISNYNSTPIISNSIVQGGAYTSNGNLNIAPFFVDAANGNLRLQSWSCAINAGNNADLPNGISTDLAGNPRIYNNGTVDMGAYEFQGAKTTFTPPTFTTNNGLAFDGTDYVDISPNSLSTCTNQSLGGGSAITIEYWFKGSNIQSAVRLQDAAGYIVAGWKDNSSNTFKHIISTSGGINNGVAVDNTTTRATDGNWHHVAMTWQKGTIKGFKSYLDGNLVEEKDAANVDLPTISSGMYLGAYQGSSEFTTGTLDEVRIWNVARTRAEIQAGMCGISGTPTGLQVYYKFDHGIANGNNAGNTILANSADPTNNSYTGFLQGFNLSNNNTTSNWVAAAPTNVTTRYVKVGGTGDGTSWANASGDLQAMINANCVQEVWVAAGTYKPHASDRFAFFSMKAGVKIYGGFNDTGNPAFGDRNWTTYETILSGDLAGNDGANFANNAENSYHVILNVNNGLTTNNSLLDGFTIKGGNANNTGSIRGINGQNIRDGFGGGMFNSSSSPSLINVTFSGNKANFSGGMHNDGSSPSLSNVTFSGNNAGSDGGGMSNNNSSPSLSNVTFSGNNAGNSGGGMLNSSSSLPSLSNVTFSGNNAVNGGGMLNNTSSLPNLINVTFSGNSANNGGGIYNFNNSIPTINNSIFWGNIQNGSTTAGGVDIFNNGNNTSATVSNSLLQLANNTTNYPTAGFPNIGTSNNLFAQDPLFVNAANPAGADGVFGTNDDGLMLQPCSPAINAGDPNSTTSNVSLLDLAGNPRIYTPSGGQGAVIDMGAYELQSLPITVPTAVSISATSVCEGSSVNLLATCANGTVTWYTASSGGTAIGTGSSFGYTPSVGTNQTFYASCVGTCESARVATSNTLTVNGNPIPNPSSDSPRCLGTTLTFSSVASMTTYAWAGPNSFTANTQSPSISNVTTAAGGTYTLTVTNASGCSASATTAVTINALPNPPSTASANVSEVCIDGSVSLTASCANGETITWYNAATGGVAIGTGSPLSIVPSNTSIGTFTYYASCKSGTCEGSRTATGTVEVVPNLAAGTNAGTTLYSGILSDNNNPIFTRPENKTQTENSCNQISLSYYKTHTFTLNQASNITVTSVEADAAGVGITSGAIPPNDPFFPLPVLALYRNPFNATSSCNNLIMASLSATGASYRSRIVSSTPLPAGTYTAVFCSFLTIPTANAAFPWNYTIAVIPSTVGVNYAPSDVKANNVSTPFEVCSNTNVALTATCASGTPTWYNVASGGTAIGTGASLSVTPTATTTYYVACQNSCSASARAATQQITFVATPSSPTVTPPAQLSVCSPNTLTLTASCTTGTVKWSDNSTGTSLTLSAVGTYSISATCELNNCVSSASSVVNLEIIQTPTAPTNVTANQTICSGEPFLLSATCTTGNVVWYTSATGTGTVSASQTLTNSGTTAQITSFYVACVTVTTPACASARTQVDITVPAPAPSRFYVNASATGANNGRTWADAFTDLQSALGYTCQTNLTEIWVAKGTYKPATCTTCDINDPARSASFFLQQNVNIYGGFPNTGNPTFADRNWITNPTILSGDLKGDDVVTGSGSTLTFANNTDNSGCVVLGAGAGATGILNTILDGFTIKGAAYLRPNDASGIGSGIYLTLFPATLNNLIITENYVNDNFWPGGVFVSTSNFNNFNNVVLSRNFSVNGAGGILQNPANVTYNNVAFVGNKGADGGGISILNGGRTTNFNNVSFYGNEGIASGGVNIGSGNNIFKNCVFWGNTKNGSVTAVGADITNQGSTTTLSNSLLQLANNTTNYPTASFNFGTGNLFTQDPLFVNEANPAGADGKFGTTDDGLVLTACSPALNVGDNAANSTTTDLAGNPRVYTPSGGQGAIDMGAYETQSLPIIAPTAVSVSTTSICVGSSVNLLATCSSGTVTWYTASSGGTAIGTGSSFSYTPSVGTNQTFYASCVGTCESARVATSNALTVNGKPTSPNPSSDSPRCAGTTLTFSSVAGMSSYAWTGVNGFTSTDQNPSILNVTTSATGTYQVIVTNSNGCTAIATTSATVYALPNATASSSAPVCAGGTVSLSATGSGSYAWTGVNGFTSTDQNPVISNATPLATGTYQVIITNTNNCTAVATTSATVNALPTATASSSAPVCAGGTVSLSATGGGSYAWTGVNGFTSTHQNPVISNATPLATGTYQVIITNTNNCTAIATTSATVNQTPATPTPQANTQIIFGGIVSLTATGCSGSSDVLKWYQTADNVQVTMPVSPTVTTQYYAKCEVTANGITCISPNSNNITVTVLQPQPPVATGATICSGGSVTLTATGCSGSTGTFVLKWYLNATDALVTMPVSPTTNTDYYAKCEQTFNSVTAISAKSNVVTVTVLNPVAPVATGGTIYSGNSITLTATGCTGSGFVIKWYQTADNVQVTMPVSPTVATQYYAKCEQTANSVTCLSAKSNDVTVVVVNRIFVDITKIAAPIQNGNSWATAYGNLQTGLSAAAAVVVSAPAEVWVAQGTYKPTTTTTRTIYFNIPSGVKVYGGFAGTENDLATRNFRTNTTTLSGDIGTVGTASDNSYHVVNFDGSNNTTLLDGFTITGGYANFDARRTVSAPGFSPSITTATIETGGGVLLQNISSPTITNCTIINNAAVTGGGIYAGDASIPKIVACKIMANQATFGAGIYFQDGSNGNVNNTLISGNRGVGAVYNNLSSPLLTNCTIAGNGGYNGGIFNSQSQPVVKNSIIWNNSTLFNDTQSIITYSTVQGGYAGTGNLNYDPKFVNPVPDGLAPNANGDYHLQASSLAIDRGDNTGISLTDVDLDGNLRRFNGGTVDMGAYEFQGVATSNLVISAQTGDWETNSTWVGFKVPALGDVVIIDSNHIVTINTTATAKSIEYRGTGQVKFNSNTAKLNIGF